MALHIIITSFPNYFDTKNPTQHNLTLSAFNQRIKKPTVGTKEQAEALIPASFDDIQNDKGSLRHSNNVLLYHGIALDFDNKGQDYLSFDEGVNRFQEQFPEIMLSGHTTFSSTPERNKYRLWIFFSMPITKEMLPFVFDHFAKKLDAGDSLDPSSKTISQVFLSPVCRNEKLDEYQYYISKNQTLYNPTKLLASISAKSITNKDKRKLSAKAKGIPVNLQQVAVDRLQIDDTTKSLVVSGDAQDYGGDRSVLAFDVVSRLLKCGIDDETIASLVLDARYGISERFLEKGQDWTIGEIDRIRTKSSKKRLINGLEPYFPGGSTLSVEKAKELLATKIRKWSKSKSKKNRAIAAVAGSGKTQEYLKQVSQQKNQLVEIYVPNHRLAEEVRESLLKYNPNLKVVAIRGRTYTDKQVFADEPLCKMADKIDLMQGFGYSVYNSLCKDCEFFSRCSYLGQFKKDTQVNIFPHAYLALGRGLLDAKYPDFAIIDESFYSTMIDNHITTLSLIDRHVKDEVLVNVIVDSLTNKLPLLANLRQTFGDDVIRVLEAAAAQVRPHLPEVTPTMELAEIEQQLKSSIKRKLVLEKMFNQLKAELEKCPEREHSITVRLVNRQVVIAGRHELTRFTKPSSEEGVEPTRVPIMCIDADYRSQIAGIFIPGIKYKKISVDRNIVAVQVTSTTNARSRFFTRRKAGEDEIKAAAIHVEHIQQIINNVNAEHGKTLVVGYKKLMGDPEEGIKPFLTMPKGCQFVHFGGLRGLNQFETCNAAVIIGRQQLPIEALESQAAALWWDADEELVLTGKPEFEERGFRSRGGLEKLGVRVVVCADYRTQILQELQRECETQQAIDRLRVIHNKVPKHVYILSSVPLDITVAKLVSQKALIKGKTRIEKALDRAEHGILPISPQYLTNNFPDLFTSGNIAKKEVVSAGFAASFDSLEDVRPKNYIDIYNRKWTLIGIRVKGRRGKHINVLAPERVSNWALNRHLKALFGPNFSIIDSTLPPRGFAAVKPRPCDQDVVAIAYYHSELYFRPDYNAWCMKAA